MNIRDQIIPIPQAEIDAQMGYADQFAALPERPQTYFIVTYGCQMNAHDSEKLAGLLEQMGLTEAADRREAAQKSRCKRRSGFRFAQHLLHP